MKKILDVLQKTYIFLLDLVFPHYCYLCGEIVENTEYEICGSCISEIVEIENYCLKCGSISESMQEFCSNCANKQIYYDRLFSVCEYDKTVAKFLRMIKFKPKDDVFERMEFIYNLFSSEFVAIEDFLKISSEVDFLLPVPIHQNRRQARGYNQSELIADIVGEIFGLRVETEIIKKHKDTKFFFGLKPTEREQELENAFVIIDKEKIKGKNIVIVDDISTTGTTLNYLAKILIDNGANMVFGFCLAKA